jgi:hypothetical protein
MKTAIQLILFLALFLWMAGMNINFKPFKIGFETPMYAFAWLFLAIGVVLFILDAHGKAYGKGLEAGGDIMIEHIKKNKYFFDKKELD